MITISDKTLCCGCTACMNACPAQCIVMRRDREGFDYPVANPDRCIGCGKCEKVCPVHAIEVVDNVARINYDLCTNCGLCAEKCPKKSIVAQSR